MASEEIIREVYKVLEERIGFKEFNKKRVKIGSFERGMHNMELKL